MPTDQCSCSLDARLNPCRARPIGINPGRLMHPVFVAAVDIGSS
jgi:hypothetical protein